MLRELINTNETRQIPIASIRTDGGTQMRAALDDVTVFEYAQAMIESGSWGTFPAVVAYYDGSVYWLGDGFHRVAAFNEAFSGASGMAVPCEVRSGTRRDAILHAAGANALHGLRRTNADKKRSVETLLRDNEWVGWSDREIARACNVSHTFVAQLRSRVTVNVASETPIERTYTTKHGTQAAMKTDGIGRRAATPQPAASPEQRQYEADVAPITVPQWPAARLLQHTTTQLPADLAQRGWELRELASLGRWYCHNANGPRATQPHDHPKDAIAAAYEMQVDLRSEPQPVAVISLDELEVIDSVTVRVGNIGNVTSARQSLNRACDALVAAAARIKSDDAAIAARIYAIYDDVRILIEELQ